ncbi:hypothetical protein [Burkholderia pseudomallei]|uniref:hypothetical protein n=1 Tax=Burkholderia pseudomallei TaxID=28450 RepID=UPI00139240D1|nr:hypothetical protein [Burkholderia pseudomallei]MCW0009728.1 hypothetical protein [Burkholderia pseudomallei]MCW0061553.1 hypothetical protein [Burkholderia pseudomallei]
MPGRFGRRCNAPETGRLCRLIAEAAQLPKIARMDEPPWRGGRRATFVRESGP